MKKLITILAVGMMFVSNIATANTKVAEEITVAWRTATRAQELVVKMGLAGIPEAQLAARVQAFAKSGTPLANVYSRQEILFRSLVGAGESVDSAFTKAFTTNGQVLSALNYSKFLLQSSAQTAAVSQNAMKMGTAANSCQATPASYLSGGDLAGFNKGLKTATALTGINLLGGSNSCANWDKEMANGFAQLVIETDRVVTTGERNYGEALIAAYMKLMGTDRTQSVANINTLVDNCNIMNPAIKNIVSR